jgi:hypothetical protein
VRDVDDDGKIVSVGVSLEPETSQPQIPMFLSPREIVSYLRRWLRARRRRHQAREDLPEPEPGDRLEAGRSGSRRPAIETRLAQSCPAAIVRPPRRKRFANDRFRTLDDIDARGKRVLVRVDLNVPVKDGKVTDATRIERAGPTIAELSDKGAKVILLSHFGRPKGKRDPEQSLKPIAWATETVLDRHVRFAGDCIGEAASERDGQDRMATCCCWKTPASIKGEEKNDPDFAAALAANGDLYVNDAFSAAHRAHASTEGLAHPAGLCRARHAGRAGSARQRRSATRPGRWSPSSAAPRSPPRSTC